MNRPALACKQSFEEEFDIEIPDDQVEKIKTVGDIVKFIEEKVED